MERFIDNVINIYVNNLSIDETEQSVIRYSMRLIISTVLGYGTMTLIALGLGIAPFTLTAAFISNLCIYRICQCSFCIQSNRISTTTTGTL